MLYVDENGEELAARFRLALRDDDGQRFAWRKGSKPQLYGQQRLREAREKGFVFLVEGESDAHTLWLHELPAVGIPGAQSWREVRDAPLLDGIEAVYLVVEPDGGGDALFRSLQRSRIRERVRIVSLRPHKDISDLYLADREAFRANLDKAVAAAEDFAEAEAREHDEVRATTWHRCASLANEPRIVQAFLSALRQAGHVGEEKTAATLFLVVVSRFLDRPVSAVLKGPSSAGKSFTVEKTLQFFTPDAYYALSAMSEKALAYGMEPLAHRMLVLYEAAGLAGEWADYFVRTLLSEGRLRYEVTEQINGEFQTRLIEREGPTGLIVTTTAVKLHPENETRLLTLPVTDTAEQTKAVMRASGARTNRRSTSRPGTRWTSG